MYETKKMVADMLRGDSILNITVTKVNSLNE